MQSIYIAGAGSGSGKSVVVLGFMELLSAINRRVGFFRPHRQLAACRTIT
jgi:phosphate acetyltransferase